MVYNGAARKRNKTQGSKAPFIRLPRSVKKSKAYQGLGLPARCALIELIDRFAGANNGMIGLGVRELSEALHCSHATAGRALQELDDARLIECMTVGAWRGKRASEWRLTFLTCNKTGELPTTNWEPASVSPRKHKVSPGKRNGHSQSHYRSA
jgi:hypothetical protein